MLRYTYFACLDSSVLRHQEHNRKVNEGEDVYPQGSLRYLSTIVKPCAALFFNTRISDRIAACTVVLCTCC